MPMSPTLMVPRDNEWTPASFGAELNTWWRESGIQESGGNLTAWNSDPASAVARNLTLTTGTPTVTTNGGENAAVFVRTSSQAVYLTSTSYTSLTAGVLWAVWKQGANLVNIQDILGFGSTGSGNTFGLLRLEPSSSQLYPRWFAGRATSNSAMAGLTTAAEEANNASWRRPTAGGISALAIECDSVNDTVRIFFSPDGTMRSFTTFIGDGDDNSGLQLSQALAGDGARGNFLSYVNTTNAINRLAIGATAGNASGTNPPTGNFLNGTVFEVGIKGGVLGGSEADFLAYLLARRALKS